MITKYSNTVWYNVIGIDANKPNEMSECPEPKALLLML